MQGSALTSLTLQGGVACSGSRCSCCCSCCCRRPRSCPWTPRRRVGGSLLAPRGKPPVLRLCLAPPPVLPWGRRSFPFLLSVPGMGEGAEAAGRRGALRIRPPTPPPWCVALARALQEFFEGKGQTGISCPAEKGQPLFSPLTCSGPLAVQPPPQLPGCFLRGRRASFPGSSRYQGESPLASSFSPASNFLGLHGDSQPQRRRPLLVRVLGTPALLAKNGGGNTFTDLVASLRFKSSAMRSP